MSELEVALAALQSGGMVLVADSRERENEVDLVAAAQTLTVEQMTFYLRYGSGIVCTPMSESTADRLELPLMVANNTDVHRTAFTVTVDHLSTGTGISAADRAATVRALASADTEPAELRRPGHVFPLRGKNGGVLDRAGHTEAALDLLALSAIPCDVAVITELVGDDGIPLCGDDARAFAEEHRLPLVFIEDLVTFRQRMNEAVERTGEAELPIAGIAFRAISYASPDGLEHFALALGDVAAAASEESGALVRVHSECLTGDVFGSQRCDCGDQLQQAVNLIIAAGAGAIVYLRGQEGRGIGLGHKLQAYALQERGYDTVDANLALGLPVDTREYGIGAAILADLGIHRLRLITNNPDKYRGLEVPELALLGRVAAPSTVTRDNLAYLMTKRDRMGHDLDVSALTDAG
jgi:3,4-dihydroxy 2-butanone 4-phosphate synthase/GTP cyclohydrolase II